MKGVSGQVEVEETRGAAGGRRESTGDVGAS